MGFEPTSLLHGNERNHCDRRVSGRRIASGTALLLMRFPRSSRGIGRPRTSAASVRAEGLAGGGPSMPQLREEVGDRDRRALVAAAELDHHLTRHLSLEVERSRVAARSRIVEPPKLPPPATRVAERCRSDAARRPSLLLGMRRPVRSLLPLVRGVGDREVAAKPGPRARVRASRRGPPRRQRVSRSRRAPLIGAETGARRPSSRGSSWRGFGAVLR
jgi:hypothetical protein